MSAFAVYAMHLCGHKMVQQHQHPVFELHLPLPGIQHLLVFGFLWGVCVGRQGDHTVHTHFEQVKAFVLAQRRLQWPEEEPVKGQILCKVSKF